MTKYLAILFLVLATSAQAGEVFVVKLINFSCGVCRGTEFLDVKIADAAQKTGGAFVYAPITVQEGVPDVADRIFYASRRYGSESALKVRRELFAGVQDSQLPFENVPQAIVYLQRKLPDLTLDWRGLAEFAESDEISQAMYRAVVLAHKGAISTVPAYALLHNGELVSILEIRGTGSDKYYELQDAVLTQIEKISKEK